MIFCDVNPTDGIIDLNSLSQILEDLPKEQLRKTNFVSPVSFAGKVAPLLNARTYVNHLESNLLKTHPTHLADGTRMEPVEHANGLNRLA